MGSPSTPLYCMQICHIDQAIVAAREIVASAGDVKMAASATGDRPVKPDGSSSSSPSSYILLVQHLIERCIVFNMDQSECVEALSKHANIQPAITITVWKELEKENKEFFSCYFKNMKNSKEEDYCSQKTVRQMSKDAAA